jgi:hypothetical protein
LPRVHRLEPSSSTLGMRVSTYSSCSREEPSLFVWLCVCVC